MMVEDMPDTVDGESGGENTPVPETIEDLQPKTKLTATVKQIELYGAFVDIGVGTNAILHISKMGNRVTRVADVVSLGDDVEVWVESVDPEKGQVTVTMIEPLAVDWSDLKQGQVYSGTVTRLEKFGAFVDIGAEKEGLIHISELSHDFVRQPSEAVNVGEEIQVQVLGFNRKKRRIDLSRKALLESPEQALEIAEDQEIEEEEEEIELPTAMEIALRRAMSGSDSEEPGQTTRKIGKKSKTQRDQQEDILSRTLKLSRETPE